MSTLLNDIQSVSITSALLRAETQIRLAKIGNLPELRKKYAYAFLNRACELASVPLTQYYGETGSSLDLAWVTYRPEAIPHSSRSLPDAMVFLGYVDEMSEDQARSKALGF